MYVAAENGKSEAVNVLLGLGATPRSHFVSEDVKATDMDIANKFLDLNPEEYGKVIDLLKAWYSKPGNDDTPARDRTREGMVWGRPTPSSPHLPFAVRAARAAAARAAVASVEDDDEGGGAGLPRTPPPRGKTPPGGSLRPGYKLKL